MTLNDDLKPGTWVRFQIANDLAGPGRGMIESKKRGKIDGIMQDYYVVEDDHGLKPAVLPSEITFIAEHLK